MMGYESHSTAMCFVKQKTIKEVLITMFELPEPISPAVTEGSSTFFSKPGIKQQHPPEPER
jgi:hypothetical protein